MSPRSWTSLYIVCQKTEIHYNWIAYSSFWFHVFKHTGFFNEIFAFSDCVLFTIPSSRFSLHYMTNILCHRVLSSRAHPSCRLTMRFRTHGSFHISFSFTFHRQVCRVIVFCRLTTMKGSLSYYKELLHNYERSKELISVTCEDVEKLITQCSWPSFVSAREAFVIGNMLQRMEEEFLIPQFISFDNPAS